MYHLLYSLCKLFHNQNQKYRQQSIATSIYMYLCIYSYINVSTCIYVSIKESYLKLESFDVVHGNGLDAAAAVGGEAGCEEEVSVCTKNVVSLEPPPACGVVRRGTTLGALHQNMALVVLWEERRGGERESGVKAFVVL